MRRRLVLRPTAKSDDTNGGFTTVAGTVFLRISTSSRVPGAASSAGTYAVAMPVSSVGEKVPLATLPTSTPSCNTRIPVPRNGALDREPDELRRRSRARGLLATASAPM